MIPLRDDNPTRSAPIVTILLIVANVAVFILQNISGDYLTQVFAMIPARIVPPEGVITAPRELAPYYQHNLDPAWVTLLTSMFLHGSWLHLGSNMLYLWVFGNNIEDSLGRTRYLLFYLLCGIAAALVHLLFSFGSAIPTVGASGAIAGVLGAYLFLFPHARVLTLVPIFFFLTLYELRAQVVLGFWFLLQLLSGLLGAGMMRGPDGAESGGVAVWAHIGGFVAGYLLIRLLPTRRPEPPRRRPSFMDY